MNRAQSFSFRCLTPRQIGCADRSAITKDKTSNIKKMINPVEGYDSALIGNSQWFASEYDLSDIGRLEDVEGYVARSFEKKIALMFKEGWRLKGKNKDTVKYIKERFAQIEQATGVPTESFLREIGIGLIKKSNTVFVKARNIRSSGGKVRQTPDKKTLLKPVAGYYLIPGETAEYKRSKSGKKIIKWRQKFPNGKIGKEFNSDDVVHFYYNRKEGFTFGTPYLIPVIDDIRALRKIEENIEVLIYQHIFPIFQYKIGTPERPPSVIEATGEDEIEYTRREIRNMPAEGGIVTPYHHEVKFVGAEGRSLKADGYLQYFRERVISGLGVSGIDFGLGYTSNKSTAMTMSQNLIDSVKDFQREFETQFNEKIIKELLLESTFNFDVLHEDNVVRLRFFEIDLDAKVKMDNHHADLFAKNVINQDEVRIELGREPFEIPTNRESESSEYLDEKYPEFYRTFWKLYDEPKTLIQSLGDPSSVQAEAVISKNSADITRANVEKARKETASNQVKVQSNKPKDSLIRDTLFGLKRDFLTQIQDNHINNIKIDQLVEKRFNQLIGDMSSQSSSMFNSGYQSIHDIRFLDIGKWAKHKKDMRSLLKDRLDSFFGKIQEDLMCRFKKEHPLEDRYMIQDSLDVFDNALSSILYKAEYFKKTEPLRFYNYGKVLALKDSGYLEFGIETEDEAAVCVQATKIKHSVCSVNILTLPPFSLSCKCSIKPLDSKNKDSFYSTEDNLRKQHPSWNDRQIQLIATAICNRGNNR